MQLQKTNQMNTQINQAYESLSARCRQLEKMLDNALLHSSQVDGAVRQLCGAMLNGMGGEIDHSQLQQFLKTVMPLLSTTNVSSLYPPQPALHVLEHTKYLESDHFAGLQIVHTPLLAKLQAAINIQQP